ncbi:MAG TPA: tRNA guanosine(34) transglycosylase Tgt [Chloroflexota bacterium]|nr:tRNA guanosine(34) transglycosylase Tgt [Chloroflexota bacterium]
MTNAARWQSVAQDGQARAGILTTTHAEVPTPVFMPVGTYGAVRTVSPDEVKATGAKIILGNTYHLLLRPGHDLIQRRGGLHRFMRWDGAILTDSGGFQVFSLAKFRRVGDDAVSFRSHLDGSEIVLTPEKSVEIQEALGSDIAMCFDECIAHDVDRAYAQAATERTHRWARRCKEAHRREDQALFGICQGGLFADMRRASAETLAEMDFPGYGIGGLSIGEEKARMYELLEHSTAALPATKPRYLMGVGSPEDLVEGVARGVDMFDCVLATRIARNGALFTPTGRLNVKNAACREDEGPIEDGCDCYACRGFSLAYLHHLYRVEETFGLRLATIHNLRFLARFMVRMREAIVQGTFERFRKDFLASYRMTNQEVRHEQKAKWLASHQEATET